MQNQKSYRNYASPSGGKSTTPRLELNPILEESIPLKISPNLHKQILLLCTKVYSIEWSGVLFYTTEGEFGKEDFSITAQELFLMDIGNSGATEYGADPMVVRHMMKHPELRDMNRGHIHSHHVMEAYFSGIDKDELVDNSKNHNYYLSLIVNNRGDMVAKVAFHSKTKLETKKTISFLGNNGTPGERVIVETSEKEEVLYFDCQVELQEGFPEALSIRFQEIQERKEKEAERRSVSKYTSGEFQENNQRRLFKDTNGEDKDVVEVEEEEDDEYGFYDRLSTGRQEEVETFLAKLVTQNPYFTGRLDTALSKMNTKLESSITDNPYQDYFDCTYEQASVQYEDTFGMIISSTPHLLNACIERLQVFRLGYERLVDGITKELKKNLILA